MVNERLGLGENVYMVLMHHLDRCRLVEAGTQALVLPESQCTCGAIWAGSSREVFATKNIITDSGDQYYAELGAGETPTNFGTPFMSLTTAQNAPSKTSDFSDLTTIVASGTLAIDGGYPQTNDSDADNPGTVGIDIITWRRSWGTSQANGTIIGEGIHQSGASGTDPLLNHAAFGASITKTSSDTLKTFVNHRANGV